MKIRSQITLLALIAAIALSVSACDLGGAPATSTSAPPAPPPTSAAQPTAAAQPTSAAQPTVAAQPTTASLPTVTGTLGAGAGETRAIPKVSSGLDKLKSYTVRMAIGFKGTDKNGQPQQGSFDYGEEVDNTAKAQHTKIAGTGDINSALGGNTNLTATNGVLLELYMVSDNSFIIQNGKCQFIGSGTSILSQAGFLAPDTLIGGINKATLVRKGESVNGTTADHYTFNENVLGTELGNMKLTQGDAWVSPDGYVVKVAAQATGTTKSG